MVYELAVAVVRVCKISIGVFTRPPSTQMYIAGAGYAFMPQGLRIKMQRFTDVEPWIGDRLRVNWPIDHLSGPP